MAPLNQLLFTRIQYAARVARFRKDLPAELAEQFGETACRDRELRGGRWPARAVLGEREYEEEIQTRTRLSAALDPELAASACSATV
jgi:hypothetical protein